MNHPLLAEIGALVDDARSLVADLEPAARDEDREDLKNLRTYLNWAVMRCNALEDRQ